MIVVDTSVIIAHLRGARSATKFLEENASRGPLLVPAIAAWELWRGASTPARLDHVDELLESFVLDPLLPAMARTAGVLHNEQRAAGIERTPYDLLIASHALFHDAPLATLDRDFDKVRGLRVIHPPTR